MNLDTAARQPAAGSGGRFYLIGYLPAYAAALFLLLLVWAGRPAWRDRPGHRIRFTTAWATASHLSPGEIVMVALAAALLAVILQPLQLALVNLAQGSWPALPGSHLGPAAAEEPPGPPGPGSALAPRRGPDQRGDPAGRRGRVSAAPPVSHAPTISCSPPRWETCWPPCKTPPGEPTASTR